MATQKVVAGKDVRFLTAVACVALLALAAGCISVSKDEKGNEKKVDISSPLGALHVRTQADPKDTGIPVYPGAQVKPDDGDNKHSANVDINSPFFGVKVVAVSFVSNDPPEKVLGFYRDKLKTYGTVLECNGWHGHDSTKPGESKPLSCDGGDTIHVGSANFDSGGGTELKAGTTDREHAVEVKPHGDGGSEFALVFVQTRGGGKDGI